MKRLLSKCLQLCWNYQECILLILRYHIKLYNNINKVFTKLSKAKRLYDKVELQGDGNLGMSEFENFLMAYDVLGQVILIILNRIIILIQTLLGPCRSSSYGCI